MLKNSIFPVSFEFWQTGLSLDAYVDSMAHKQEEMRQRLRSVVLTPQEARAFMALKTPTYVLVMTEDWCPDSLMNLPILAAIASASSKMELRIFVRSQQPDLQAAFAERGIANIPLFVFYAQDFREIGIWVERSRAAHSWVAEWNAANPQFNEFLHDEALDKAQRRVLLAPLSAKRQQEMERAYEQTLQSETVAEIQALLVGHTLT